jgi:hypothetical protein
MAPINLQLKCGPVAVAPAAAAAAAVYAATDLLAYGLPARKMDWRSFVVLAVERQAAKHSIQPMPCTALYSTR